MIASALSQMAGAVFLHNRANSNNILCKELSRTINSILRSIPCTGHNQDIIGQDWIIRNSVLTMSAARLTVDIR